MKIKVNFKSFVLLALFTALSNFLSAQKTITGLVTDADNADPLVGAAIVVTGTTKGTLTDVDGKYELQVPNDATTLTFSYTGYASVTVPIGTAKTLDMKLKGNLVLEQVVVVGYGSIKNKEVTSAITSVKADDFTKGNVNDPVQLLQGKVAGLTITRAGGDPNGGFEIRLRGLSTINGNSQPLVVVDGVIGADLATIDPNDIAQIDVLKDGSAAAIYGVRGTNGVILVTTKKGVAGQSTVEYNGNVSIEQIANKVSNLSATDYIALNQRLNPTGKVDLGSRTDWFKEVSRDALTHTHNLSLGGGANNTTYRFSVNYRDAQGINLADGFKQLNGRADVTQKAFDGRLTLNANLTSTTKDATYGFSEAFRYATIYNPTAPIADDGTISNASRGGYFQQDLFDYYNPVAIVKQSTNQGKIDRLQASFKADYKILPELTASAQYTRGRGKDLYQQYYLKNARYIRANFAVNGAASQATNDYTNELGNFLLNYNKGFGKLSVNGLAGYEYQEFVNQGDGISGGNILTDKFTFNNLAASQDFSRGLGRVYSYKNSNKLISFFARVGFGYDDTYSFSASVRRDGSSRFGENNKWGIFPAVSGSVNIIKLAKIQGLDQLKLRAGYGVTGTDVGSSYLSLLVYGPGQNALLNGSFGPTYGPSANANPDLKWEKKGEINVGLDFAAMDYRLTGTVDYFTRTTTDLLYQFVVPVPPNLASTTWANVGELNSKGIEATVNYKVLTGKDLSWNTSLNFATNDVTLISLSKGDLKFGASGTLYTANVGAPGLNGINQIRVKEGQPIGEIWGKVYVKPNADGTPSYQDLNGDGKIDDDNDRKVLGNGLPKFTMGFSNTFKFGALDVNFFFRGVFGHSLVNEYRVFSEVADPSSIGAKNIVKTKYYDENLHTAEFSSRSVEKADFVKLDNASIGYTVALDKGSAFKNVRFSLTGNNLLVFTGYTGVDPEPRLFDAGSADNGGVATGHDPLAPGIDRRSTYFRTRSFTLGVNLGF